MPCTDENVNKDIFNSFALFFYSAKLHSVKLPDVMIGAEPLYIAIYTIYVHCIYNYYTSVVEEKKCICPCGLWRCNHPDPCTVLHPYFIFVTNDGAAVIFDFQLFSFVVAEKIHQQLL